MSGLWKVSFGEIGATLKILGDAGLMPDDLRRVRSDASFAQWLVGQWKGGPQPSEMASSSLLQDVAVADSDSQGRCRELFREDFFGVPEVVRSYGYVFSAEEQEERKPVRLLGHDGATLLSEGQSWDAIRCCHDEAPGQFVLCAGVRHSVCDVHAKHRDVFHPDLRNNPWFGETDQYEWSKRAVWDYWFLLRKDVVPDSWDRSSEDQMIWLRQAHASERFAFPEHITYGSVLCAKATQGRVRLYGGERWGRTLHRAARRSLVSVRFHPYGLNVGSWNGDARWVSGVPSLWTS